MFKLWNNTDKIKSPANGIRGWFRGQGQLISGWAIDSADPNRKLDIEMFVDGHSVGIARADRYDPLVQEKEGGDGLCAFAFYYVGLEEEWAEATVTAREVKTGTELRTKLPTLHRSDDGAPRLTIHTVAFPHVMGTIGGYPAVKDLQLEFWDGDRRVASDMPVEWQRKSFGEFKARLSDAAMAALDTGLVEAALPGMKEAGLAVPVSYVPATALLAITNELISIQLPRDYEGSGSFPITVRLAVPGRQSPLELQTVADGASAAIAYPTNFPSNIEKAEILVDGTPIPVLVERTRDIGLADPSFVSLVARDESPWAMTGNVIAEAGFFAFPAELVEDFGLSGHTVRLRAQDEAGSIRLAQSVSEDLNVGDTVRTVALFRSPHPAQFQVRLCDEAGVLAEEKRRTTGENIWFPVPIRFELDRAISGPLTLVLEADSPDVSLALSSTASNSSERLPGDHSPLLANGHFESSPSGAAPRRQSVEGSLCEGWRFSNHKSSGPVLSQTVTNPVNGSIGIAFAAAEVPSRLRVEASLEPPTGTAYELTFRAGVPPAAHMMAAELMLALPEYIQLFRIQIVRRGRMLTKEGIAQKEEVGATVAKKVAVGWDTGEFQFQIPRIQWPAPEQPTVAVGDTADLPPPSYHLIFEFRGPAAIAIYDVELSAAEQRRAPSQPSPLMVEDRNIAAQIPKTRMLEEWGFPSPVVYKVGVQSPGPQPLKWSLGPTHEPLEIVIPVFNALDETLGCLQSINGSTSIPVLVRIIDDGSDPHVPAVLEGYAEDKPWIAIHSFGTNRGYTYAADFGIRSARSSWVVLLNSDTIVTQGWLEGMINCARSDPAIALVGPLSNAASFQSVPDLYEAKGGWKTNALPRGFSPEQMAAIVRAVSLREYPEAPLLNGFCTLIRRSTFLEIGGLDHAAFPMGYGEENDLCIRARKAGTKLAIADDIYVFHHKSASFGSRRRTQLSKQGSATLRELHPEVDIEALKSWFADIPALAAVRSGVAEELRRAVAGVDTSTGEPAASAHPMAKRRSRAAA